MNARALKLSVLAATLLGLSACAGTPAREQQPHHYSKDASGNRIACYAAQAANEYECVPVARRYGHPYDPYYPDLYWPSVTFGLYYGWPHYYYGHGYPYPVYRYPPPHWRAPRRR